MSTHTSPGSSEGFHWARCIYIRRKQAKAQKDSGKKSLLPFSITVVPKYLRNTVDAMEKALI